MLRILKIKFDNPGGSVGVCCVCGVRFETEPYHPVSYLGRWEDDVFSTIDGGGICGSCAGDGPGAAGARADAQAAKIRAEAERYGSLAGELTGMGDSWDEED